MDEDYSRIRVGGHDSGIMGLKAALAEAVRAFQGEPNPRAADFLFERLSSQNYFAPPAREEYKKAFYREYRKHLGLPAGEEEGGALEILVVGPGCVRCEGLEQTVMSVMAELDLAADLQHIRDVKQIAKMGIMGSPALVIAGKIKCVGTVPSRNRILDWLKPYAEKETKEE